MNRKKDEYWEEVVKTLVMDLCQCVVLVGVRWARQVPSMFKIQSQGWKTTSRWNPEGMSRRWSTGSHQKGRLGSDQQKWKTCQLSRKV